MGLDPERVTLAAQTISITLRSRAEAELRGNIPTWSEPRNLSQAEGESG